MPSGAYKVNLASMEDDGPLIPVPLPSGWALPFFGEPRKAVFVGPNGYVRVVSDRPCGGDFSQLGCDFSDDYDGVIGPLITDFAPNLYDSSVIMTAAFDARQLVVPALAANAPTPLSARIVCVSFVDMGLYYDSRVQIAPKTSYTFILCLYGDGGVRWRYGRVFGQLGRSPGGRTTDSNFLFAGGPPPSANYSWIAGVRSLGAVNAPTSEAAILASYDTQQSPDIAVESPTELLLSRGGVRPMGTAAICSLAHIGCAQPACGASGTLVRISWRGAGCGLGFEALSPGFVVGAGIGTPRIECVFGAVAVPATWATPLQNSSAGTIVCIAPIMPDFASNSTVTVPLLLRVRMPTSPLTPSQSLKSSSRASSSIGVGPAASPDGNGEVVASLDVYGIHLLSQTGTTSAAQTSILLPHKLLFTYSSETRCGCSSGRPALSCDACGVCGGNGSYTDCAGVCFGSASLDDCGVCSGGSTQHVRNSDVDCLGKCFGSARGLDCFGQRSPSDASGEDQMRVISIIIVTAMLFCLSSLCAVLGYLGGSALLRQRALDAAIDALLLGGGAAMDDAPRGAAPAALERQAVVVFDPVDADFRASVPGGAGECSICLCDFSKGDVLRQLRYCSHAFHRECVEVRSPF